MSQNLYQAHKQWAVRCPDDRFADLNSLHQFVGSRRTGAIERTRSFRDLSMVIDYDDALAVNGEHPVSRFSHWSFGQLCEWMKAPAPYLRRLPVSLVAECLQHSISHSPNSCQILIRQEQDGERSSATSTVAAITGPKYSRIWDTDIVETLIRSVEGTGWHVPRARSNNHSDSAGLYASDRDMFVFFVNDEQPIEIDDVRLGRGFFCWNSETGAASFGLTTFLYNYVCQNHIVWGAEQIEELRIIHRDNANNRFRIEAIPVLNRFVENLSYSEGIKSAITAAKQTQVGVDLEQVLKWGEDKSFSHIELTNAWETGQSEGEDVSTVWGIVQGLTAYARQIPFMNARVNLERRAGNLLKSNT